MFNLDGIKPGWIPFFKEQCQQPYFQVLKNVLKKAYHEEVCYPAWNDIFRLFRLIDLNELRVVIIGQDPYHNVGQANGMAFSVTNMVSAPPSLKNIFNELSADLEIDHFENNDLSGWVQQGVFLMNAIWTVEAHKPASHCQLGWKIFTSNLLKCINSNMDLVYMLWGNYARSFIPQLTNERNCILSSAHPSPLSYAKFANSKPFSKINEQLAKMGKKPINWKI